MKKFKEIIVKYKVYILSVLLLFFFFKSCSKSAKIKKLENFNVTLIDSLSKQNQSIDSFPEKMRVEKINIHLNYDIWISEKDRGPQLMELHKLVKNNIKELQK